LRRISEATLEALYDTVVTLAVLCHSLASEEKQPSPVTQPSWLLRSLRRTDPVGNPSEKPNMYRRYLFPVLLAAITVSTLSACATAPSASGPIPAALAATPSISTFRTLATQAGLSDTLAVGGPYTVFAPSDEAFKAVPAKTMAELRADKAKLQAVLNYHIVPKRLTAADVQPGSVKTLQGGEITVARAGTFVTVEDAMVVQADILASNGVVHVVDRVLMPPSKK